MKIAIIEDDVNKRHQIRAFVEQTYPKAAMLEARSFNGGRKLIVEERPDVVLLDMSMPTFDVTAKDLGGRHRAFAGREVLEDLAHRRLESYVIIVTQFDIFGEGATQKTLQEIRLDLESSFPRLYVGAVYYDRKSSGWQKDLSKLIDGVDRKGKK